MLYLIKNVVDEYHTGISGYFPTLKEAIKGVAECADWFRPNGTGKIYQVEFGIRGKQTLVWEDGVYMDKDLVPKLTNEKLKEKKNEMSVITLCEAYDYIGSKCAKFSGKRFKDGSLINTIKDAGYFKADDGTKKLSFIMDDNYYVPCSMVYIID